MKGSSWALKEAARELPGVCNVGSIWKVEYGGIAGAAGI